MHGLARGGATTIDNFWTDVTRVPVYLLLPACIVLTLVYVAPGDASAQRISRDDADVHLTPKEYALLCELARHPGRVVTHRQLLANVWDEARLTDVEYLRGTMRGLRAKLKADPASPRC